MNENEKNESDKENIQTIHIEENKNIKEEKYKLNLFDKEKSNNSIQNIEEIANEFKNTQDPINLAFQSIEETPLFVLLLVIIFVMYVFCSSVS